MTTDNLPPQDDEGRPDEIRRDDSDAGFIDAFVAKLAALQPSAPAIDLAEIQFKAGWEAAMASLVDSTNSPAKSQNTEFKHNTVSIQSANVWRHPAWSLCSGVLASLLLLVLFIQTPWGSSTNQTASTRDGDDLTSHTRPAGTSIDSNQDNRAVARVDDEPAGDVNFEGRNEGTFVAEKSGVAEKSNPASTFSSRQRPTRLGGSWLSTAMAIASSGASLELAANQPIQRTNSMPGNLSRLEWTYQLIDEIQSSRYVSVNDLTAAASRPLTPIDQSPSEEALPSILNWKDKDQIKKFFPID